MCIQHCYSYIEHLSSFDKLNASLMQVCKLAIPCQEEQDEDAEPVKKEMASGGRNLFAELCVYRAMRACCNSANGWYEM